MSGISLMMLGPLVSAGGSVNPNAWDITKYVYQPASSKYDVTKLNGTYATPTSTGNYYSVASQESAPSGISWRPDGLVYFIVGSGSDNVTQYSCSRPWDITSSAATSTFSVSAQEIAPSGIYFKQDGTSFYIVGTATDRVRQYDLATAWSLPSASYVDSFSVSSQDTDPQDLFFKPDGTKMYIVGTSSDSVHEYTLSTAWDVTSASFVQSLSVSSQDTSPRGIAFNNSGTVLFVMGDGNNRIYRYNLATAWDLSSASYISQSPVLDYVINTVTENSYRGLWLDPRESVLYFVGGTTDTVLFQKFGSVLSTELGAGDLNVPKSVRFGLNGLKMYVVQDGPNSTSPNERIHEFDLSSAYNIYTASYLQSFGFSAQEAAATNITFKPDGTKFYLIGTSGDDVNEYNLSTAWDISSASFVQSFSVASEDLSPVDVAFKSDGTKMYVLGDAGNDVNEYSLATAWDVSTASYVQSFSVSTQEGSPRGLAFKPDGTEMYVTGISSDNINQYSLSTAWDISTASFLDRTPQLSLRWVSGSNPESLFFSNDGTRLFLLDAATYRITEFYPDPDL